MAITLRHGDCRDVLRAMPDKSVHCCVTSPPYFGLRDYGTAKWDGGDAGCDHSAVRRNHNGEKQETSAGTSRDRIVGRDCHCGAIRIDSQIGLEPTPDAYVAELVAVFREVRRVLRDDGTLWLNLGDSYVSSPPGNKEPPKDADGAYARRMALQVGQGEDRAAIWACAKGSGLPQKNLLGMPWRVAFALQADGWYLRQDIIWSKPNPMPESVTDRCTKAHEYIFLMSKQARYFYDADAIKEDGQMLTSGNTQHKYVDGDPFNRTKAGFLEMRDKVYPKVNKRSVWEVTSQPFAEAHFATFPPDLIEPCIKAGCPIGGTVLDPFGGAGTTGMVADRLGRNAILIELNPDYAAMAERRIRDDAGMFAEVQS